jgi:hypothetical protein
LESILGLLKSLKIRALYTIPGKHTIQTSVSLLFKRGGKGMTLVIFRKKSRVLCPEGIFLFAFCMGETYRQGVTKSCRLSWLTNSAHVYEPKCGRRGVAGSQSMSTAVHMEPK